MSAARAGGQSRHARPTMKNMAALAGVAIKLAAQLLFARLDGDDSPARTHVVPTGMVMRGSGEIRPPATTRAASR